MTQALWPTRQLDASAWELPIEHEFQWPTLDETTDGRVRFVTTVELDSQSPDHILQDALRRVFCIYVVGHLSEQALGDACQSLADIYSWQIAQTRPVQQIPDQTRHAVSQVRRVERVPFVFDED